MIPLPRHIPRLIDLKAKRAIKRMKHAADDLLDHAATAPQTETPELKSQEAKSAQENIPVPFDLVSLIAHSVDPASGQTLTREEQRDNLIGFFIAGHETTALTLTWALYLISQRPRYQELMREELDKVSSQSSLLNSGYNALTYNDLGALPYTRAVLDATLRLYPPAPLFNRECQKPCVVLGRQINKGDHILIVPYIMHRKDAYWEDPMAFKPERFLDNPALKAKGAAFMPFGAGPRICIGGGLCHDGGYDGIGRNCARLSY